jgi:filamentous hemagglutinin
LTDEVLATPQVQSLMKEAHAANSTASDKDIANRVAEWLESGSSIPTPATAAPGSVLIKVVPKGDGVTTYSPYWMSPEQARAIGTMTPEQAGHALGLPAEQAAKMLNSGLDYYAITPKPGVMPKVFVSDVAPTKQGSVSTAPTAQQVIVPNRSLWTAPKPVNPFTLR